MNEKLDARTKWSYCIGATGRDAAYALVSMYLILYVQYTMNLTSAQFAVISAAMVVCMIWDAVNDLLMGIIIENTHFKMGKFKPWILIGCISNAIVIVCLFTIRPSGCDELPERDESFAKKYWNPKKYQSVIVCASNHGLP